MYLKIFSKNGGYQNDLSRRIKIAPALVFLEVMFSFSASLYCQKLFDFVAWSALIELLKVSHTQITT